MKTDEATRKQAINPQQSFIVQAPAGSGKTELLTQRYLNLLANAVQEPEEIIAITFTRKAAGEMRERIIGALQMDQPENDYQQTTWQLAQAVLTQNQQRNWQLLENPNRLRILTIDALSTLLCAQTPLLSGFGAQATITDNPSVHYQQAVKNQLENPGELLPIIENLLLHLNNNANKLAKLLQTLLEKREQWLPHIFKYYQQLQKLKAHLESNLKKLVTEKLKSVYDAVPDAIRNELVELARFAANELIEENSTHKLCHCRDIATLPIPESAHLEHWQGLAELLLTQSFEWRKALNKNHGFAPKKKAEKERMYALIEQLRDCKDLKTALIDVLNCPPTTYTDNQWTILQSIITLLPLLTAELQVQFRQQGAMDFVELTLGALQALGTEEAPTDLALHLDYQIKHLLIDEFQDTSISQYRLLRRLVQEWQSGDGKTLFLVGDPMQSIYRFRDAEVSLFIRAQKKGIANVQLTPLTLTRNFRSSSAIVDWVNKNFKMIFPKKDDIQLGAIAYSPAIATRETGCESPVTYQAYATQEQQSQAVVSQIQSLQTQYPNDTIAVLARSRSQLTLIMQHLSEENIPYQAVELEELNKRQEVIDLVVLTRALIHWGDRIAWLSVLRAPWCGLTLKDLHQITQQAGDKPLWPLICQSESLDLSVDAKQRLQRFTQVINTIIAQQGNLPLALWIKAAWLGLEGPACLQNASERQNVEAYFDLLDKIQHDFTLDLLEQRLKKLYAKPVNDSNTQLQLMTIHKSKGLEFDHILLPDLQKAPPHEKDQLLMWQEAPNLLLAPIKPSEWSHDPIHGYLKHVEKQKLQLEFARLFYVAITRAKQSVHFFCQYTDKKIANMTLLSFIWENYEGEFLKQQTAEKLIEENESEKTISRLPINWQSNYSGFQQKQTAYAQQYINPPEDNQPAIIGTVIHEALQLAAQKINRNTLYWKKRLLLHGLPIEKIPDALALIIETIEKTRNDKRGQWLLQPHQDARSEYALTTIENGKCVNGIIDRTFIDENGMRWIIDYKTAEPQEVSLDAFLQHQQERYRKQLENYAKAFQAIDNRPIALALYFPRCPAWIEWRV